LGAFAPEQFFCVDYIRFCGKKQVKIIKNTAKDDKKIKKEKILSTRFDKAGVLCYNYLG